MNLPPLKLEEKNPGRKSGTNQLLDEDDPFFEQKLRLGSHMAILACKLAKVTARNKSPSPDGSVISVDSLNTVDTHTTSELRAISKLGSPVTPRFTPNPPKMAATMKKSRLPPRAGKFTLSSDYNFLYWELYQETFEI